jgi:pSer/pThr/pTyr-binding forkhead associated (FHA) protein
MRPGEKITIGRDQACDIPVADDSVSRRHAELTMIEAGKLLLVDCQSSNGTAVLEEGRPRPIRQAFVTPSDRVQFGSVVLNVSDLVEAVSARKPKAQPQPERAVAAAVSPHRLVRCECGVVKAATSKCPECGQ